MSGKHTVELLYGKGGSTTINFPDGDQISEDDRKKVDRERDVMVNDKYIVIYNKNSKEDIKIAR